MKIHLEEEDLQRPPFGLSEKGIGRLYKREQKSEIDQSCSLTIVRNNELNRDGVINYNVIEESRDDRTSVHRDG